MDDFFSSLSIGFFVLLGFFYLVGVWKAFEKAGQPGWAAIVPIYNLYVILKIAGKPGWWLLLLFIPVVNFVVMIIVYLEIAARFERSVAFGLGLCFLGFIFWPLLGLGDAEYVG
jgi:hypothetical protein